jgi:hypothetical protein
MNTKLQFASFGRSFDTQKQGYPLDHGGLVKSEGTRPLNPVKTPPPKRSEIIKVRLTEDELKTLKTPLTKNGRSKRGLSEEIRARLFRRKSKTAHGEDCEHCRLLANVANGLNIIARQCETFPNHTQAVEVIVSLRSLEREILKVAK